jgi:SAM-dependent methyltransferase
MHPADHEQKILWNGPAGRAWVEAQAVTDQMFKPSEDLLVEAVSAGSGTRVLDVGCGTGSTTLAVARSLGVNGHCTGIDISEPMLAAARARAERENTPATFIQANAEDHPFQPESFDMITSRFGVMFFDDFVRAFANLRAAATNDAKLWLLAWRSAAENPFMTTAERAAAPLLPNLPARRPDAPGQFAFADGRRVDSILNESGWAEVDIQPIDLPCSFPESGLLPYLTRIGPVGRILQEVDDQTRTKVIETVLTAFEPYLNGNDVRFTAACWMVRARRRL